MRPVIERKTSQGLAQMREAGRIVAAALALVRELSRSGVTTGELDRAVEELIRKSGAEPAFLGYTAGGARPPFPGSICTSVNEGIVHGIPGDRMLNEGDVLSVDIGVKHRHYYGDAAITVGIGQVSLEAQELMDVTQAALDQAVQKMQDGEHLMQLAATVQGYVESHRFSVVRRYTGHGIGRRMHEDPQVPNFVSREFPDYVLRPGMVLAIEPMVNAGTHETRTLDDQWTEVTRDGRLSAHFEHSVAVTADGPEILTLP